LGPKLLSRYGRETVDTENVENIDRDCDTVTHLPLPLLLLLPPLSKMMLITPTAGISPSLFSVRQNTKGADS
jgi:hypothetical protein